MYTVAHLKKPMMQTQKNETTVSRSFQSLSTPIINNLSLSPISDLQLESLLFNFPPALLTVKITLKTQDDNSSNRLA
jgi:hypothetical protein